MSKHFNTFPTHDDDVFVFYRCKMESETNREEDEKNCLFKLSLNGFVALKIM